MLKKLLTMIVATALALSMANSAFAAFADLELIRVYYERSTGTVELATDLGNVTTLIASGGAIPGSFGTVGTSANMFAAYFAVDRGTNMLWVSGSADTQPVAVGGPGYTTLKNGSTPVYSAYNGVATGINATLPQSNLGGSYTNKLSASQGSLGNAINIATRPNTEISLASLVDGPATSVTQVLYSLTGTVTGSSGVAVATITTNADGSTVISHPPLQSAPPGAPTIGTASPGDGQATVSFTAPDSDGGSAVTGYTATSTPGGFTGSSGTVSPITVNGLTNGMAYTFTVTATNRIGTGPASKASNSVTPLAGLAPPGAPTMVSATAGNAQATVSFSAPADGGSPITGYEVTSTPAGGTDTGAGTTSLSHVVTGLTNGTAYTFAVIASNGVGPGNPSTPSGSVTPAAVTSAPGAPTGVTAKPGDTFATVSFGAPVSNGGSAITGYTLTATPGGFSANVLASPVTVSGLSNGTEYTFTVTATNAIGTGPVSTTSSVTPSPAPGAPGIGSATAGNAQATVTFTAPVSNGGSAVTGYTVTSIPAGGTDSNAGTTSLSHVVTGLKNGTPYTFTVTASNPTGPGPSSAQSNGVTPSFPPLTFNVSPAAGGNGYISPAAKQTINAGASTGFTVTASAGYQISTVTGCGGSLNGSIYTTAGVMQDCSVTASFIAVPALKGDLNGDGKVDIADALLGLQFAVGLKKPTAFETAAGDIAPLVGGKSAPDGKIDITDAVAILQKSVGLLSW